MKHFPSSKSSDASGTHAIIVQKQKGKENQNFRQSSYAKYWLEKSFCHFILRDNITDILIDWKQDTLSQVGFIPSVTFGLRLKSITLEKA